MSPPLQLTRRNFFRLSIAGGAGLGLNWLGSAQPPTSVATLTSTGPLRSDNGSEFIDERTRAAIDAGLAFLSQVQGPDGAFAERAGGTAAGITGLAGLALMSAGHQPGRGKYAKNVSRAIDHIITLADGPSPGFLATPEAQRAGQLGNHPSAIYSHGFASLFLAEVCGMLPKSSRQKKVREVLESATAFAVDAQNKDGGWRYEPRAPYADVSVTVAIMMALRAARSAGLTVRQSVIRAGSQFIRACQMPDGGFSYYRGGGGFSAFARSAAAVVGLYSAAVKEDDEINRKAIERGLAYLQQFIPGRQFNQRELPSSHYFYGQYYAALAMWTAGGELWRTWFPAIRDELLGRANAGTWTDSYGSAYATAMSLIILQLPNNYLPILQK